MSALPVTISDIEAAAARIVDRVDRTPIVPLGATGVLLKCEGLQRTGSFKIRGASNAVLSLRPERVVTASSGNHGQAVAAAAKAAGCEATIVMPVDASAYKRQRVLDLGATVVDCGPETSSRELVMAEIAHRTGATVIPAYDHPLVIAGQGTIGLEIHDVVPDMATVVVPVGGGGLISGIATALAALSPRTRVIGVEPAAGPRFAHSRAAGHPVEVPVPGTMCDGARTQRPGVFTGPIVEALVHDLVAIDDEAVINALGLLAGTGLWVEPTAALAVAAAQLHPFPAPVVCLVTGSNISPQDIASLLATRSP